jgi:hypothetical protein
MLVPIICSIICLFIIFLVQEPAAPVWDEGAGAGGGGCQGDRGLPVPARPVEGRLYPPAAWQSSGLRREHLEETHQ